MEMLHFTFRLIDLCVLAQIELQVKFSNELWPPIEVTYFSLVILVYLHHFPHIQQLMCLVLII